MRALTLLALVACGARPSTPHEPAGPAYQLGGLRIEGAPPIDPAIGAAWDAQPLVESARLYDLRGDSVMVGARGRCMTFDVDHQVLANLARSCDRGAWWGSLRGAEPEAYLVEDEAEQSALFIGGERIALPPGRISDPLWSRERDLLLFGLARADSPGPAELWMWSRAGGARRIADGGPWAPLDISADHTRVLARVDRAARRSILYQIGLATLAQDKLSSLIAATPLARYLSDGDVIAVTDAERDHFHLVRFPTGHSTYQGPRRISVGAEITQLAVASDDRVIVASTLLGRSTLSIVDGTGQSQLLDTTGETITDLRADGDRIGFTSSSPRQPHQVWIGRLVRRGGRWAADPELAWPAAPPPPGITPTTHPIRASDGLESQLIVYRPANATKAPVVLEFHSGPEDRWHLSYDSFAQFLVARGYAVVRPNVRGSTEQGRGFEDADNGPHRADVLRDVRATLDWIAAQPDLDAGRVAVAGTSYGGYLALASVLAFPERIRGAATLSPITDFVGFLEGTAPYRRDHRRAEYGDERVPELRDVLTGLAPVNHVGQLARPVLISYGQRDPRVPPATTERFIRAARAAGKTVWSVAASDEGHWFESPDNRRAFEILTVQFLDALKR